MGTWHSEMKKIKNKRIREARKRGGFDFSYIDKKFPTKMDDGRPFYCKFCAQKMYMAGTDNRDGSVLLSCEVDECIGNVDTPEHIVKRKLKEMGLDTKLNFSGRKALLDNLSNQVWLPNY